MDDFEKTYRVQLGKYFFAIEIDNHGNGTRHGWRYINLEFLAGVQASNGSLKVYHYLLTQPLGDNKLREHLEWIKNAYRKYLSWSY